MEQAPRKPIHAEFFRSDSGSEPVRDVLKRLGRPIKTQVGEDIRFVELNWPVDKPYVDRLRKGKGQFEKALCEVRHTVLRKEYRTLFFISKSQMVLVHFFQKRSQKTPLKEIEVAWNRMKSWVTEEKKREPKKVKRKSRR